MSIASLHRLLVVAAVVAASSPAVAQEVAETAPTTDVPITAIATFTMHNTFQISNQEVLQGFEQTVVLGFRLVRKDAALQQFFEAGISRLDTADSPLVTSSALIGARFAWRWQRLGLHLAGRFHHGEAMSGDDGIAIYSHYVSFVPMVSLDLIQKPGRSLALAAHAVGQFHDAADADAVKPVFSGGGGLSLVLW